MSANQKFTEEQMAVLAKVEKLMRLAAKNPNENEAAAASAKAMELLEAYNLSADAIDINGETSGKRAEEALIGGFYQFERNLWNTVAELNFCWYFTRTKYIPFDERKNHRGRKITHQHILIGKVVNIAGTKAMAGYLMQTIERLTKAKAAEYNVVSRSSWAVSYRRGIAERVIEKINQRRWDILNAEERAAEAAAVAAREAGVSNVETALTIKGLTNKEYEANYDFMYGAGAYAKAKAAQTERRARQAKAEADAQAAYTKWAEANPEEAAKAEAKRIADERRKANRGGGRTRYVAFKGDWHAYSLGREAGKNVGIDPQTGSGRGPAGSLKS